MADERDTDMLAGAAAEDVATTAGANGCTGDAAVATGEGAYPADASRAVNVEVNDGDRTEENASPEPEMEDRPALVLGDEAEHDAELREEVIDSEIAWRGKIFDVERLQVRLPNGHTSVRDVVRHRGAAAVVALTTSGKIALVRQYRTSLGRVTVEIPAGKLDYPGEDPLECAKRELKEETGFVAGRIAYLTTIATSCGFADELIHIYLATQLSFEGARPDDDEFLNVDLVPVGELVDAVLDGKIEDAKTVVGALACEVMSRRLADAAVAEEAGE